MWLWYRISWLSDPYRMFLTQLHCFVLYRIWLTHLGIAYCPLCFNYSSMHATFLYWQLCILLISFGYCSYVRSIEEKKRVQMLLFKISFVKVNFETNKRKNEEKYRQCLINSPFQSSVKSMYLRCWNWNRFPNSFLSGGSAMLVK